MVGEHFIYFCYKVLNTRKNYTYNFVKYLKNDFSEYF